MIRIMERRYRGGGVEVVVLDGEEEVVRLSIARVIASLQEERRYEVETCVRRADSDLLVEDGGVTGETWTAPKAETAILRMPT